MKKAALGAMIAIMILCGCGAPAKEENTPRERPVCGVWISYYELSPMLASGNFKEEFSAVAENLAGLGASDAFVHVRAFGESLFLSNFYPRDGAAAQYDFDVLEYMIETLKEKNVRFHAWINPFRNKDGSFSDPADEKIRAKITGEIRELVNGYDLYGIHFDDYFYTGNTDSGSYGKYRAAADAPLDPDEYRTAGVTWLIFAAKSAAHSANKDIVFSVSPAADISKNLNEAHADVRGWCERGLADWIIPQLYFGFDYPDEKFRFNNLLSEWKEAAGGRVKLITGLAAYKLGTADPPDAKEWQNGAGILKRQTEICLSDSAVSGVCYFSYTCLFAADDLHRASLAGIKEALNASKKR